MIIIIYIHSKFKLFYQRRIGGGGLLESFEKLPPRLVGGTSTFFFIVFLGKVLRV